MCWLPAAEVEKFLLAPMPLDYKLPVGDGISHSRLTSHLSPTSVKDWLMTASKCERQKQLQLCIDHITTHVGRQLEVDMGLLNSLDSAYAARLLAAIQHHSSKASSMVAEVVKELGSSSLRVWHCCKCKASWMTKTAGGFNKLCCPTDRHDRGLGATKVKVSLSL